MTMNTSEFEQALKLGLGRAILHLQQYPAAPHREAILHACLHDLAFDPQIEGERAEYMFDIIELTGEQEFYRRQILAALADSGDDWDASQLFALARRFAAQGDADARRAMYDKFTANCQRGDGTGAEQLSALDGIPGFLFVAEHIGRIFLNSEDDWKYDYLFGLVEERCGKEEIRLAVEQAAAKNLSIKTYLECVAEVRTKWEERFHSRRKSDKVSYAELKMLITEDGNCPGISVTQWGKLASDADITQAAADLLLETNPNRLQTYLRIFWRRCFPLDVEPLITFARDPERKTAARAMRALEIIHHPKVRALAFDLIATSPDRIDDVPDLLIDNYQEGDYQVIESLLLASLGEDDYHSLGIGILKFCEAHSSPESEERIMLALYERDPCSFCRKSIVERLLALGRLPRWMADECRFDANLNIREKFMR